MYWTGIWNWSTTCLAHRSTVFQWWKSVRRVCLSDCALPGLASTSSNYAHNGQLKKIYEILKIKTNKNWKQIKMWNKNKTLAWNHLCGNHRPAFTKFANKFQMYQSYAKSFVKVTVSRIRCQTVRQMKRSGSQCHRKWGDLIYSDQLIMAAILVHWLMANKYSLSV